MVINFRKILALVLLLGDIGCTESGSSQKAIDPYGLTTLQPGRGMRASSSAVDWADSNADARSIQPGHALVLAEFEGPGMIRHIWNTVNSKEYAFSKQLTLWMYWDGEKD